MPTDSFITASDGVRVATRLFPGNRGPTLALVHATGFCQALWDPVIEELGVLGADYTMITWDQRGHGASDPPRWDVDWWDLGRDALEILSRTRGPVVGVGHSSGATALLEAEILSPGRFASIVAIEPIVFPPPYGPGDEHPLAEAARRRRPSFPNRETASVNFSSKQVFAGWDLRAMDAYIRFGLVDMDDGVRLACDPAVEAAFYAAAGLHQVWDRLNEVAAPVTLVAGARSDSHPVEFLERQAAELPRASTQIVPGAGHFLPMEKPRRTAQIIAQVAFSTMESTSWS